MTTKELISEAISLPVEKRSLLVDLLLKSLNPSESGIDNQWITVARTRLAEMKNGAVKPIPGDSVFEKIWERYDT